MRKRWWLAFVALVLLNGIGVTTAGADGPVSREVAEGRCRAYGYTGDVLTRCVMRELGDAKSEVGVVAQEATRPETEVPSAEVGTVPPYPAPFVVQQCCPQANGPYVGLSLGYRGSSSVAIAGAFAGH